MKQLKKLSVNNEFGSNEKNIFLYIFYIYSDYKFKMNIKLL